MRRLKKTEGALGMALSEAARHTEGVIDFGKKHLGDTFQQVAQ